MEVGRVMKQKNLTPDDLVKGQMWQKIGWQLVVTSIRVEKCCRQENWLEKERRLSVKKAAILIKEKSVGQERKICKKEKLLQDRTKNKAEGRYVILLNHFHWGVDSFYLMQRTGQRDLWSDLEVFVGKYVCDSCNMCCVNWWLHVITCD